MEFKKRKMKRTILLLLAIALGNGLYAQDLSKCKKTCTEDRLVEWGPFLGVRIVTSPTHQQVRVMEVVPNTTAARNHFAVNDIITEIDGVPVNNNVQVIKIIKSHKPNDVIRISYLRNNKPMKKRVALGALHSKIEQVTICCDEPFANAPSATSSAIAAAPRYTLFPNPATNSVKITSDLVLKGAVEISVLDMQGKIILTQNIDDSGGVLNEDLNIKNLANGNYIVKIKNNNVVSIDKLVVRK